MFPRRSLFGATISLVRPRAACTASRLDCHTVSRRQGLRANTLLQQRAPAVFSGHCHSG